MLFVVAVQSDPTEFKVAPIYVKPLISEIEKLRLRKNDFEIRKTIGRGHFGEVHVVREKVTGNVYAMKVLKKSSTLSQDNVAFFEEERDIMAFANNPWITSLQYAFQDYDSLFLVMDFHPGGDLLSLLAKYDDVFEENIAKFYLGEMIMAMHAVHALGYVHRDIKPENVLIDRLGHVKLADFGSSARLSSAKMVVSKMPVGTPEYIAPEVLMSMDGSGGGGKYGIECDWWSLGVVAYEMMIGYTPFQADSVVVVYSQIMNFKNSLEFPDDQPLSDDAKGLIRSLLTDQKERINYADLAKHPFFTGLDWTTLQDAVPPYVPTIEREDDTSNFDDFETENSGPRLEDFMEKKRGFQGNDLPFIGFTFTKQLTLASLNETEPSTPTQQGFPKISTLKRDSMKDANNAQVMNLMKELDKEQKKHKELQAALTEKTKASSKIEADLRSLENEKVLFETEKKDFERQLKNEKSSKEKADREKESLKKEIEELRSKFDALREETSQSNSDDLNQTIHSLERQKESVEKKNVLLEENIGEHKKMLDDSKQRVTDLQAKLTKVSEDTKNNVSELQQKLLKVTSDNEDRIKAFQEKLSKALDSAQDATSQLTKVEKEKEDIEKELIEVKSLSMMAKPEVDSSDDESKTLQKELTATTEKNSSLKEQVRSLKSDLEDSQKKYGNLVEFGEDLKAQVERKIEKLQKELANSRRDYKKVDQEYKKLKQEHDERNNNLSSKDSTIATLQASCESLEHQLNDLVNAKECSTKELDENMKIERMELSRQLSEISSEKRNTDNEIKTLQKEIQQAQETIDNYKEKLHETNKQLEENTDNYENELKKLKRDVTKANDENDKLHKEKTHIESTNEEFKERLKSLQNDLDKHRTRTISNSKNKDVEAKLTVTIDNLKADKKVIDGKLQKSTEEAVRVQKERDSLQEELNEKERQSNSQELTIQMLKQTCTMLEGQVEELEVMNDEYQDRETQWNMIKRQQYQAQEKLEQQLSDSINTLEAQRKLRSKAEEKVRHMEDNVGMSKNDVEKTVTDLEQTIQDLEEKNQEVSGALSTAEERNGLNSNTIKTLERKLASEVEEKEKLATEVSQLEDLSAQQTSSNFSLTVEIEELKERQDDIIIEKENLENQIERTSFSHAEEKIKLESTLAQQTKLIDFLQKKVMVDDRNFAPLQKKKDKNRGKGKSTDQLHAPQQADIRKTRDLERALEKAKNENLQLHLQLQKARDEVINLRTELQQIKSTLRAGNPSTPRLSHGVKNEALRSSTTSLLSKPGSSPSTSVADIYQMAANEVRGNGNVPTGENKKDKSPHHLQQTLNMRSCKCPVCLNTAPFAKQVSKCTECHMICHTNCVSSLPNLCGVARAIVATLALNMNRSSMVLDDGSVAIDVTDGHVPKIEGWLKYPRKSGQKQSWDRKWIVLVDSKLMIYDDENTIEFDPSDEIDLNITEGELNIHPAIPTSELSWVASNDLPYVFSIEIIPYTLGWPRRTLYFLSPTFSDKQRWVFALERISDDVKKTTQKNGHGMADNVIMTIEGTPRDINCATMINETGSVLGADDGLYVVSTKSGQAGKPVPIVGLGPVYQMEFLRDLDIALLIAGKERIFCYIDISSLENRLKQLQTGSSISAISAHQIEKVKSCHLFTVAKIQNEYYACAATSHKLNILKYQTNTQTFVLKKELETNEPCTCLLIATNYVIFGTSKFYTVDLKNFQKRDFLDASDTSLAFAVFGTSQSRNFPISVFNVSKGKTRDEYLLCYSEFGIFVDWQGRRSRKGDLKWSRLPLAFEYYHPHLYITHFSSIEICEILQDLKADIGATPRRFIDIPDPRFLGEGLLPRSVLFGSTQDEKMEIISYVDDLKTNGLSRNASIMSGISVTSPSGATIATLEHSRISEEQDFPRSSSSYSVDSDEETSRSIEKKGGTPKSKRKDQLRTQEKDKNRISFRFFKGNRKSQLHE